MMRSLIVLTAAALLAGCNAAPTPQATKAVTNPANPHYPAHPSVAPPPFKVFHHDDTSFTLVTADNASTDQIESLIWQLRDAAHTHTFDHLHVSQKAVDDRKPIVWFHIYRGSRCASEKYSRASLPAAPATTPLEITPSGVTNLRNTMMASCSTMKITRSNSGIQTSPDLRQLFSSCSLFPVP